MDKLGNFFLKVKNYTFILPLFLVVWIFYQFIILSQLSRMEFFSWSQVINDTVVLFIPTLFGILGILLWLSIEIDEKKWFTNDIFGKLFLWVVIYIFFLATKSILIFNSFWVAFLFVLLWKGFIAFNIFIGSKKMKSKTHRKFMEITLICLSLIGLFNYFFATQYKWLEISIDNQLEKVLYFNDRYVITENSVIKNNENTHFIFHQNQ